ncbi:MAG: hypothetical protein IKN86_12340 [Bacteroidaceae bacterium]|nr:hypothetical protein [Bacteroidaceae bacterium]
MKDYKQIADKYAEAVRKRKGEIHLAEYKIERLKSQISFFREQREQYRQSPDGFSSYKATMWKTITPKIAKLEKELEEAEENLGKIFLGAKSVNDIVGNV